MTGSVGGFSWYDLLLSCCCYNNDNMMIVNQNWINDVYMMLTEFRIMLIIRNSRNWKRVKIVPKNNQSDRERWNNKPNLFSVRITFSLSWWRWWWYYYYRNGNLNDKWILCWHWKKLSSSLEWKQNNITSNSEILMIFSDNLVELWVYGIRLKVLQKEKKKVRNKTSILLLFFIRGKR